ncbi:hypothetical protein [Kitasatospora sp. NPDC051914]|uniref:hypothetical protein n=1 Tax=Kitasatospora sp. NPDC051914 TaxID=3154945 RepID=UPI0034486975
MTVVIAAPKRSEPVAKIAMRRTSSRIPLRKVAKGAVVAALTTAAIALTAPMSSASNEADWKAGCRGHEGKFDSYECTFKINKTHVSR